MEVDAAGHLWEDEGTGLWKALVWRSNRASCSGLKSMRVWSDAWIFQEKLETLICKGNILISNYLHLIKKRDYTHSHTLLWGATEHVYKPDGPCIWDAWSSPPSLGHLCLSFSAVWPPLLYFVVTFLFLLHSQSLFPACGLKRLAFDETIVTCSRAKLSFQLGIQMQDVSLS